MAILSKIRERSMFLILVIGLALFAFVLDPSTLGDFFNSSKINEVGAVNGDAISRTEFAEALENYQKQTGGRVSEMQAAKTVWDNLLREKIYTNQLEEAGITVGEEDVWTEITNAPSVQNNPQFQTAGLFDEEKLKQFLANAKENNPQLWTAWSNYMKQIKSNLQRNTYNNLVTAGLGASLKEGEVQYFSDNTKVSGQFVYIPYTSIPDSLVTISESDIKAYINKNEADFKVEESRDISYVKFDIKATPEDEEAIKNEVTKLLEDREEYSSVTKGTVVVKGLKNTEDLKTFFSENGSDLSLDDNYKFKTQVTAEINEAVFNGKVGDVFGPYKHQDHFKLSKITEVVKMPDSVKASHILIPFVGSRSADAETTKTEEEVKKMADSLVNVIKRRPSKFADLAKELSADKSNADKGGDLDWFNYTRMVPEFRDYAFQNKKGDIGVVKTVFGFHIIKIEGQKNIQNVVKLATFGRKIVASEETENEIFQEAEMLSQKISENVEKFYSIVKDAKKVTKPAIGLKVLDENVPGLGKQRQIVSWAFESNRKKGDFKRFDLEGSHVVALLTEKTDEGIMEAKKASARVRPTLLNEKKAALISDKLSAATLADIAKDNNTTVRSLAGVTLKSPTVSGVGNEPKLIGSMMNAKENELYKGIDGSRGVFAFIVTGKELPTALPNYDSERNRISESRKRQTFKMYDAIKKASDVEDNRATFYGIR